MANPTTNYGWPMPTSTDLVTDLPADFALFGQPVDTTLKALNPETTLGDIAYRSATSNTNTRLGIGTNGQVLAVSGGVPAWTTTADVTPLTTKGDLFTFTTVDARIGVGANGTVLTADSAEATGLKWATPAGGSSFVGAGCMKNSNQSIPDSTFTAITFAVESFDTSGIHDTSTNTDRFTVPSGKAGYWLFNGNINWASNASGYRQIAAVKNGTLTGSEPNPGTSAVGNILAQPLSAIFYLAVADYISFYAFQNSGGSLNVDSTATGNGRTFAYFTYLGA